MKHTPPKLMVQLATAIRLRNYSYRTEQAYCMWTRQYIRFHNITHPADMAETEVAEFLSHLTLNRNVAPNTQNQALNALNFLYSHVLGKPIEPTTGIVRAEKSQKLPIVQDRQKIRILFREMDPHYWLLTGFMYCSRLRLND